MVLVDLPVLARPAVLVWRKRPMALPGAGERVQVPYRAATGDRRGDRPCWGWMTRQVAQAQPVSAVRLSSGVTPPP